MEQNSNNIPELQSPFEQLREVDADGIKACSTYSKIQLLWGIKN